MNFPSSKSKKTRRGLNKKKGTSLNLVVLGCNAAGLKQKSESLKSKIDKYLPGCVFIQETKL